MKIKLEIELDLPEEYVEYSDAELGQVIFDYYTNYVTTRHLADAVRWMGMGHSRNYHIVAHHEQWANIADSAKVKVILP